MIEETIAFLYGLMNRKVTYSMERRNGPSSYDCSSAVYYALIAAGYLPAGHRIGNTDSLFGDLERNGWEKLPVVNGFIDTKRGDVFIWGIRGASSGAFGHTGMFTDADNVIHCNAYYDGIYVNNYDGLAAANGWPKATFYRYTGKTHTPPSLPGSPTDQVVEVGSYIKFAKTYRVDDVQLIGGVWQVRTNTLCKNDFTWVANGIPAAMLTEVGGDGYATVDQELAIGAKYKIAGKYRVLDIGHSDGMWLAMISHAGLKFWVDIATATEVSSTNDGTPTPTKRPTPPKPARPTVPATPAEPTPSEDDHPEPEQPEEPATPVPEVPEPKPTPNTETNEQKKEEPTMAFTKEQQEQLSIATEKVRATANDVAASEGVQQLVSGISKRTKFIVYLIGDSLIGLGLIIPSLAVVFATGSVEQIVALSSMCATAGAFVLTMFGIYKSGKSTK